MLPQSETRDEVRASSDGPAWIRETLALGREEVTRFVDTVFAFVRRPRQFGSEWFAGRQRALNPLGCVATALAVTGFVSVFLPDGGKSSPSTLLSQLGAAVLPYVYYAAVGVVSHPLLRMFGSRRQVSASIAIALFAGGGPGFLTTLALQIIYGWRVWTFGPSSQLLRHLPLWATAVGTAFVIPLVGFFVTLMLAMSGLHQVSRKRSVAAVSSSVVLLALVLGALHRHIDFGIGVPHLTITYLPGLGVVPDIYF
jgi:hypothetical protein